MLNQLQNLFVADNSYDLTTTEHIQGRTSKWNTYAKQTDRNVNPNQSKVMLINTKKYNGQPVENGEDFTSPTLKHHK